MGPIPPTMIAALDRRKLFTPLFVNVLFLSYFMGVFVFIFWFDHIFGIKEASLLEWIIRIVAASYFIRQLYYLVRFLGNFTETGLCLDNEFVFFMGRQRPLQRVRLGNISEVQVRPEGSWRFFFLNKGVGLVLIEPEYFQANGKAERKKAIRWFKKAGCHFLIGPYYRESTEKIAISIAAAARAIRGTDVPIVVVNRRGKAPMAARPLGESSPAARPAMVPSARALAVAGTECVECGYDLRLLPVTALCPECGTPVKRSLGGRLLSVANRDWVSWLTVGSLALSLAGVFSLIVLWLGRGLFLAGIAGRSISTFDSVLTLVFFLLAYLLVWFGAWFITRPEPVARRATDDPLSRRLVRIAIFLPLIFISICLARMLFPPALVLIGIMCLLPIVGLTLFYARHLLRRLSRPGWGAFALVLSLGCFGMSIFGFATIGLAVFGSPPPTAVGPAASTQTSKEGQEEDEAIDSTVDPESSVAEDELTPEEERILANTVFAIMIPLPVSTTLIFFLMSCWLVRSLRIQRESLFEAAKGIALSEDETSITMRKGTP